MGFYSDKVVPRLVTCACGTKPILKQREKVVPQARGRVLEIGMGAGHNLPYYRAEQVERIVGIDPCSTSWALAKPRATYPVSGKWITQRVTVSKPKSMLGFVRCNVKCAEGRTPLKEA